MYHNSFRTVFASDILRVKQVVNESLEFLNDSFAFDSAETLFELRLIISEVLLNAVQHGNDGDSAKKVSLEIAVDSSQSEVVIKVTDEGCGFDFDEVSSKCKCKESLLEERGRGIRLISSLVDDVSYNSEGNEVSIFKRVVRDG